MKCLWCFNVILSGDGDNFQGGGGVQKDDDVFDPPLTSTPRQQSNHAFTSFQAGNCGQTFSQNSSKSRGENRATPTTAAGDGGMSGGDVVAEIQQDGGTAGRDTLTANVSKLNC